MKTLLDKYVFLIDGLLAPVECASLIERSEGQVYEEATISAQDGAERREEIRNNDRILFDDASLTDDLWKRIKPYVPEIFASRRAVGLNERWRFYRYEPGQFFDWHMDGYYARENGERSYFTFLIYLNDDFEGGATTFCDVGSPLLFDDFVVTPKVGSALLFFHPTMHRGDPVEAGRKYVLRTDVMYSSPHM